VKGAFLTDRPFGALRGSAERRAILTDSELLGLVRPCKNSGRCYEWHEVNAQHAFMRDEGPRYDPALFPQSVRLALDFYSSAMSGRSGP
jgi:hypothetical protein